MSTLQQHKVKAYWNTFIISIIVFYSQNQFNKLGNTMKETRYWSSQEMSPDTCSVIHPQNIIFINLCTLKVYSVPSGLYHHQAEMLGCLWHVRNKFVSPLCSRIYVCATSNKSLGKRILKFSFLHRAVKKLWLEFRVNLPLSALHVSQCDYSTWARFDVDMTYCAAPLTVINIEWLRWKWIGIVSLLEVWANILRAHSGH